LTKLSVDVTGVIICFVPTDQVPVFRGFLQVYDDLVEEDVADAEKDADPGVKNSRQRGGRSTCPIDEPSAASAFHQTPGPLYESSLVKELESLGTQASTYALIVSTVIDRKYVRTTPSAGSSRQISEWR